MAKTVWYGFPLYEDDAAPDLTVGGEEAQALEAVDTVIHAEESARIAADEAEAEAREKADTQLAKDIAAEESARIATDTALEERIGAEADTRAAEYALLKEKIEAETTARETADGELGGRINQEVTDRQEQDAILGTEVTGLNNSVNGIMSLDFGPDKVALVKVDEGVYSSPALEAIESGLDALASSVKSEQTHIIDLGEEGTHTLTEDDVYFLTNHPQNVAFTYSGVYLYLSAVISNIAVYTPLTSPYDRVSQDDSPLTLGDVWVSVLIANPTVGAVVGAQSNDVELYKIYPASTSRLGPVKVGSGLSIDSAGTLSVDSSKSSGVQADAIEINSAGSAYAFGTKITGELLGLTLFTYNEYGNLFSAAVMPLGNSNTEVFHLTGVSNESLIASGYLGVVMNAAVTLDNSGSETTVQLNSLSAFINNKWVDRTTSFNGAALCLYYIPA